MTRGKTRVPDWVMQQLIERNPRGSDKPEQITVVDRPPSDLISAGASAQPISASNNQPQQQERTTTRQISDSQGDTIGTPMPPPMVGPGGIDTVSRPDTVPNPDTSMINIDSIPKSPHNSDMPFEPITPPSRTLPAGPSEPPTKRAGDVHVGERVLSANAAKAIDDDTFAEFSKQLESGTLDHNAFRQFLKMPPKPGYAAGSGATPVTDPNKIIPKTPTAASQGAAAGGATTPTAALNATPTTVPTPGNYDTIINQNLANLQATGQGTSPTVKRATDSALQNYDTAAAQDIYKNNQTIAAQPNVPQASQVAQMGQEASAIRSGRSDLIGNLANTNEQNAEKAAADAASLAASERSTQRQTQQEDLNTLIQMGVTENLPAITAKLKDMGITANPAALVTAENQQKFSSAMTLISQGIASGMTQEQIVASLQANGVYDALNSTIGSTAAPNAWTGDPSASPITAAQSGTTNADQAKWLIDNGYTLKGTAAPAGGLNALISGMKESTNTVDQAWNAMTSSEWYKSQTPETQAKLSALNDYALSGQELPYNITQDASGKWTVTPKTEAEITAQQTGQFAGDPYGADAQAILAAGTTSTQAKSVLDAIVTDITTRHDVSKLNSLPANVKTAVTQDMASKAVTWDGTTTSSPGRDNLTGTGGFADAPANGSIVNYNGQTYIVTSDVSAKSESGGRWTQQEFSAIDVATGQAKVFTSGGANSGGKTNVYDAGAVPGS